MSLLSIASYVMERLSAANADKKPNVTQKLAEAFHRHHILNLLNTLRNTRKHLNIGDF